MRRSAFISLLAALLAFPSCFSRDLRIETEPAGARVFVDRVEVGRSPLEMPFHWGGKQEILLLHEEGETRYRPTRVVHDTSTFHYDTFPFDVLTELTPIPIHDHQEIRIVLEPVDPVAGDLMPVDAEIQALLGRAEVLRDRSREVQELGRPPAPPFLPPPGGHEVLFDDGR
ncbi:MAG: PEGA domain-containing protein [Planctomycetes bacterium]|nr:PEGA domain-containing protein [Planctomycetota bacterium]